MKKKGVEGRGDLHPGLQIRTCHLPRSVQLTLTLPQRKKRGGGLLSTKTNRKHRLKAKEDHSELKTTI